MVARGRDQRDLLERVLAAEIDAWSRKPLSQLEESLQEPHSYECPFEGQRFQVEVQLLEVEKPYVHVGVAVDNGSLWRTVKPVASSFIVYRDGRIDR